MQHPTYLGDDIYAGHDNGNIALAVDVHPAFAVSFLQNEPDFALTKPALMSLIRYAAIVMNKDEYAENLRRIADQIDGGPEGIGE